MVINNDDVRSNDSRERDRLVPIRRRADDVERATQLCVAPERRHRVGLVVHDETPCGGSPLVLGSARARRREACVGKRRRRAERAIEEVQERARLAGEALVEDVEETVGGATRRNGKSRRGVDRSARKAEHKLGRLWNRGRFRVRRLRRRAEKRIDHVMRKAK